jgi:hypothetical protein
MFPQLYLGWIVVELYGKQLVALNAQVHWFLLNSPIFFEIYS